MFHPNYAKLQITISRRFAIAYAVCFLIAAILATVLAWIIIHHFAWLPCGYYLITLILAKIATTQVIRNLRDLRTWKKHYAEATEEPAPRVKRPACSASIFGSNNTAH